MKWVEVIGAYRVTGDVVSKLAGVTNLNKEVLWILISWFSAVKMKTQRFKTT
jgi:hypothetical protein